VTCCHLALHVLFEGGGVVLPRVMKWYRKEFGATAAHAVGFVVAHTAPTVAKRVAEFAAASKIKSVRYAEFCWDFAIPLLAQTRKIA
jgi:hypothetical protein